MATPKVGADIESICGKCGDVWHVVVAKVGDKIARVQCKQCLGSHRHKPPEGSAAAAAIIRARAPGTRTTAPRKAAAPPPEPGPRVAADPSRPPRPYRATETWRQGDRIQHPTFGAGVVESDAGPGKIHVWFPGGRRILAQAKADSTLSTPPPRKPNDDDAG